MAINSMIGFEYIAIELNNFIKKLKLNSSMNTYKTF